MSAKRKENEHAPGGLDRGRSGWQQDQMGDADDLTPSQSELPVNPNKQGDWQMSVHAIKTVLAHSRAKGPARLALVVLAEHANERMESWPSYELLAKEMNVSRSNAARAIANLRAIGEVSVTRGGAHNGSNVYRITVPESAPPEATDDRPEIRTTTVLKLGPSEGVEDSPNSRTPTVLNLGPLPSQFQDPYRPKNRTRTTIEPSMNHQRTKNTPLPPTGGARELNGSSATQPSLFGEEEPLNGKSPDTGPTFEEFWKAYPKKVGKKPAARHWKRHPPEQRQAAIERASLLSEWLTYLRKQDSELADERYKWLPHGSTFVNEERWQDDPSGVHSLFVEWLKLRHRPRDPFFDEQYETDVERAARLAREGAARNGS